MAGGGLERDRGSLISINSGDGPRFVAKSYVGWKKKNGATGASLGDAAGASLGDEVLLSPGADRAGLCRGRSAARGRTGGGQGVIRS